MEQLNQYYHRVVGFLPNIAVAVLILIIFIFFSWLLKGLITKRVKPKTKNPLLAEFLGKIVAFTITITGFVFFLRLIGLGSIATHIVAGAGITTFIIGFAFKDIGENFLSGILMAFKSPFKTGDLIETNGTIGYVTELNLRETTIKSLDGKDVYIPNSQILKTALSNYTIDGYLRYELSFGVDYETDFNQLIQAIYDTLKTIPAILHDKKKPLVVLEEMATSTVNVKVYYWIDTFKSKTKSYHLQIKSDVIVAILYKLNKLGIYLPADIFELKNYNKSIMNIKTL